MKGANRKYFLNYLNLFSIKNLKTIVKIDKEYFIKSYKNFFKIENTSISV